MRRFLRWLMRGLILVLVGLLSFLTAMRFAIHGREVSVPILLRLSPEQAEKVASDNGLLLSRDERYYSSDVPAGHILSQEPGPGEMVRRGWRVRVAESLG